MKDLPRYLLWIAVVLALLGFIALINAVDTLLRGGQAWGPPVLIALSELLITAAGFLFAGVELWRAQEHLRKPRLVITPIAKEGTLSRSRVQPTLYALKLLNVQTNKLNCTAKFSGIIQITLAVEGDTAVGGFSLAVAPSDWQHTESTPEGKVIYTIGYHIEPCDGDGALSIPWRVAEASSRGRGLRLQADEVSVFPGDTLLVGGLGITSEIGFDPEVNPQCMASITPRDFRVQVFSETTAPQFIDIIPDAEPSVFRE